MDVNMIPQKTISVKNNKIVIKYWCNKTSVFVAAFNESGKQVSACIYSAAVDIADNFYSSLQTSVIESLATTIENDLLTNPDLHYRP